MGGGGFWWKHQQDELAQQKQAQVDAAAKAKAELDAKQKALDDQARAQQQQLEAQQQEQQQKEAEAQAALAAQQKQLQDQAAQLAQKQAQIAQQQSQSAQASAPPTQPKTFFFSVPVYSSLPMQQASPLITAMLKAVNTHDLNALTTAYKSIEALPKPAAGNVAQARKLNADGLAALKSGNLTGAINLFMQAASANLVDKEIAGNLGYAYTQANQYVQAVDANAASLTIDPTNPSAWGGLGIALARRGNQSSAQLAFLLSYWFAPNKDRTLNVYKKMAASDPDPKVKAAASSAVPYMTNALLH